MKDLTVEIPKKYRKQLSKRFSISNFTYDSFCEDYTNDTPCILCKVYSSCEGCPFEKFATQYYGGCLYWISKIVGQKFIFRMVFLGNLSFDKKDKDFMKSALKKLKEGAKKYIKWV